MKKNENTQTRYDVLLFLKDVDTQAHMAKLMGQVSEVNWATMTGGLLDCIEHFKSAPSPRVLVVDCSDSEIPVSDFEELRQVCEPDMKIIAIGDLQDVALFRDLISIDIQDYLVKPITADVFLQSVTGALGRESQRKKGAKVFLFLGTRGGVGATTLAMNTASYLANEQGKKVVLIDLDLQQGNVAVKMNLGNGGHALREALESPDRVDNLFIDRSLAVYGQRLKVLQAEESLEENIEQGNTAFLDSVENLLNILSKKFHYIFIDCPRYPASLWRFLNTKADQVILVSELTIAGLRETDRFMKALSNNKEIKGEILILNRLGMYEEKGLSIKEFQKALGHRVSFTFPFCPEEAIDSLNLGKPLYQHHAEFSKTLMKLMKDMVGAVTSADPKPTAKSASKGLWNWISNNLLKN